MTEVIVRRATFGLRANLDLAHQFAVPRRAADSAAGSTLTKSHSADPSRCGAGIAWIRYQGPGSTNG